MNTFIVKAKGNKFNPYIIINKFASFLWPNIDSMILILTLQKQRESANIKCNFMQWIKKFQFNDKVDFIKLYHLSLPQLN